MSKEKFWAEGSMDKESMGEIISLVREQTPQEDFAKNIGCSLMILKSSEEGKGNHVYGTFMKVCEKYNLTAEMQIKEK